MKRIILNILGLLAVIGISYGLALLLVNAWLPEKAGWLLTGIPMLAVILPLAYWLLANQYRYTKDIPYFLLKSDFLLPLSAYVTMLLLFVILAPRMVLWQWGNQGIGTVQLLSLEEREDPDYGTTQHFRVDFSFEFEGNLTSHTSYISQELYDSLQVEDAIKVHYVPWWPRLITAGDLALFGWQATVLLWAAIIVSLWLGGTAVTSRSRYAQPPPPPFPEPKTALELLQRYDLDTILTEKDDAELWAAVIRKQYLMPEDETIHIPGMRFGIGEYAPEARLKMQPLEAACFSRIDDHHLRRELCVEEEQTDADFDNALKPVVPLVLLYLNRVGRDKRPFKSIIVPWPSANEQRLSVYTAVCHTNGNASGETAYWERIEGGPWQYSGEKINWWMDGA